MAIGYRQSVHQRARREDGAAFLADIAEFFTLFRTMERPIVARAKRVGALLSEPTTSYVVVTSAEPVAVNEAGYLVAELRRRRRRLNCVLVNRLMPSRLASGAVQRADAFATSTNPALRVLATAEREIASVTHREISALGSIRAWETDLLVSEARSGEITDVAALLALGMAVRSG